MRIQKRTMGWLPRASLYDETQARQNKQRAAHKAFISSQANLAGTVSAINADYTFGTGQLVSNVALSRIRGGDRVA
jgi:hypothetical protein